MKALFVVILLFAFASVCASSRAHDPKYPAYDPEDALFQRLWPWPKRVSIPSEKIDIGRENELYLASKGRALVYYAAIVGILGLAVCCAMQNKLIDTLGAVAGFGGMFGVMVGMLFMKVSEWWKWGGLAMGTVIVIGLVVYCRDKGMSIKSVAGRITRKKKGS